MLETAAEISVLIAMLATDAEPEIRAEIGIAVH